MSIPNDNRNCIILAPLIISSSMLPAKNVAHCEPLDLLHVRIDFTIGYHVTLLLIGFSGPSLLCASSVHKSQFSKHPAFWVIQSQRSFNHTF